MLLIAGGSNLIQSLLLAPLQITSKPTPTFNWKTKNVLIVLGCSIVKPTETHIAQPDFYTHGRIQETARLYWACKQTGADCVIITSGGDPRKVGTSQAKVFKIALGNLGVNSHDIITENTSLDTHQNAKFTTNILKGMNYDAIYLITSGYHLKRSLLYFTHFGIYAYPWPSDYLQPRIAFLPSSYNFILTDIAIHEYTGFIRYYVYNLLGRN